MSVIALCGRKAPAGWKPNGLYCVRPLGHEIKVRLTPKLKKERYIEAHVTEDGRVWPRGDQNTEYL